MQFTFNQLANIANWNPIMMGFDRDHKTIEDRINPILKRLTADGFLDVGIVFDGALSNYFAFIVFKKEERESQVDESTERSCVAVQLSLFAPIGVYGKSSFFKSGTHVSYKMIEPENVLDPTSPVGRIQEAVVDAVHWHSPYRLVGRDVTDQPLPKGITIEEYCLSSEPWNKVFHALFANTD